MLVQKKILLGHCQQCGKLQFMHYERKKVLGVFGELKAIVYIAKCKKCKHTADMIYEEV